jgi:hypothetical protein
MQIGRNSELRPVKTKESDVSCDYSDNLSAWFSGTVIITVLKSVARKRLVKIEDFYISCDHSIIGVCGSERLL